MKTKMNLLFHFSFIGLPFLFLLSCSIPGNKSDTSNLNITIPADEFEKKLTDTSFELIDVRTPEEFAEGHIELAQNINYNSPDFEQKISQIEKGTPVLIYCLSGGRSASAAEDLGKLGFKTIYNLEGGLTAWNFNGKKTTTSTSLEKKPRISSFDFAQIIHSDKLVLVDYNTKWCEPCRRLAPLLDSLALKNKDKFTFIKIDADANKALMRQRSINGVPVLEFFENGDLKWKHEGIMDVNTLIKEMNI
jgi:thioredoxin 1